MSTDEDIFKAFDFPEDTEPLDPSIAAENDPEEDEDVMISRMTYSDYLSAVYSFEEKAFLLDTYRQNLVPLETVRNSRQAQLDELLNLAKENRRQREKLHDDALKEQKDKWQRTQDRLDVKIAQEVGTVRQQAQAEIKKKERECLNEIHSFNNKIDTLKRDLTRLDNERKEIEIYRSKIGEYSAQNIPVADESVLELLEHCREHRILTQYHRDILKMNADDVCEGRVHSFEELETLEKDFAESDMVKEIIKGKVTKEVINEFSIRAALICAALLILIGLISSANPQIALFQFIVGMTSAAFWYGGSYDAAARILKLKFPQKNRRKMNEIISFSSSMVFMAVGILFFSMLIMKKQTLFSFIYIIISSSGAGFLLRQLIRHKDFEGLWDKVKFLKNRARYHVFNNYSSKENGKYNLQIYCYLNHKLVLHYLSIKHIDELNEDIDKRLKNNLDKKKQDKKELAGLSGEKKKIVEMKKDYVSFAKLRARRADKEVERIEAKRGEAEAIDFESKLPQSVSSELIRLDAEYENLQAQIQNGELAVKRAQEHLNKEQHRFDEAEKDYQLIEHALRYWYKTPSPSATDYRLLDAICFESKRKISIIHHNLKPFAFKYIVKHRDKNPSECLKVTIFKYIRGLIKINPCRMIQINIIDPVSDPNIILQDERFKLLSPMGVISGVHSVSDFEIRLFSTSRNYNTFRSIFKTQCMEISSVVDSNREFLDDSEHKSIELANKIIDDESEPFMYQIMMFIVPRAFDQTSFEPPAEVVRAIEKGTYLKMGLLPIFFVDNESIHSSWKRVVSMCPESCVGNVVSGG